MIVKMLLKNIALPRSMPLCLQVLHSPSLVVQATGIVWPLPLAPRALLPRPPPRYLRRRALLKTAMHTMSFRVTILAPVLWTILAISRSHSSMRKLFTISSTGECSLTCADYISWNPAVGSECKSLIPDYDVCIGVSGSSGSSVTSGTSGPTSTTISTPSPIMPGTDPSCTSYYYVEPNDSCSDIEQEYDITADEVRLSSLVTDYRVGMLIIASRPFLVQRLEPFGRFRLLKSLGQ
jgi:hypothetical protein